MSMERKRERVCVCVFACLSSLKASLGGYDSRVAHQTEQGSSLISLKPEWSLLVIGVCSLTVT